jgi:hypothetical protein
MQEVPATHTRTPVRLRIDQESIDVLSLHRQVVAQTTRIELGTSDGQASVLISKLELDALEQALAILSSTDSVISMRDHLARIAAAARLPLVG